jgi:ubiquinone/menaquinone biosynthesis C-methylase UbiE
MSMHRKWHFIDETTRREWQNPEAVLHILGLNPGFIFVDLGCGDGFFALPAARLVGSAGKVYGIDISSQAIDRIRRKAENEGLSNLELITGKAEETVPCSSCADIVFFGDVLHDFQDPTRVVSNARRIVKPNGKLANLDWKKTPTDIGPPNAIRFDEATAISLIESAGFKVESVSKSGKYHYLITANPVS